MKTAQYFAVLAILWAMTCTGAAYVVNEPGGSYIVNPLPNGNTLITGDNSSTTIQRTWNGFNVIGEQGNVLGAITAASLASTPRGQVIPVVTANPDPYGMEAQAAACRDAWAQVRQQNANDLAMLASMGPFPIKNQSDDSKFLPHSKDSKAWDQFAIDNHIDVTDVAITTKEYNDLVRGFDIIEKIKAEHLKLAIKAQKTKSLADKVAKQLGYPIAKSVAKTEAK